MSCVKCSARCGAGDVGGFQTRTVVCRAYDGEPSGDCDQRTVPPNRQECRGHCTGSLAGTRIKEGITHQMNMFLGGNSGLKVVICLTCDGKSRPKFQKVPSGP